MRYDGLSLWSIDGFRANIYDDRVTVCLGITCGIVDEIRNVKDRHGGCEGRRRDGVGIYIYMSVVGYIYLGDARLNGYVVVYCG